MNNFEKIKNMTLDEMAENILSIQRSEYPCNYCASIDCCQIFSFDRDYDICIQGIKQWLQQESEG